MSPPPIRFFCNHCNLMMKIGPQMFGRIVVCPECGRKLEVPYQSDPKAEALYLWLKQKRTTEKDGHDELEKLVATLHPTRRELRTNQEIPAAPTALQTPPVQEKPRKPAVLSPASKALLDKILPEKTPSGTSPPKPAREVPSQPRQPSPQPVGSKPIPPRPESPGAKPPGPKPVLPEKPQPEKILAEAEPDEVDQWIEDFWASVPENNILDESEPSPSSEANLNHEAEVSALMLRLSATRRINRVLYAVLFLFGFGLGYFIHSTLPPRVARPMNASADSAPVKDKQTVSGNLFFRSSEGARTPDADAVVVFLPLDNVPSFPIIETGLRTEDIPTEGGGEGVQQVIELGGGFQRTGADGRFSLSVGKSGRYMGLFISSHARRRVLDLDVATTKDLGRFFSHPEKLLGEHCFSWQEYDLSKDVPPIQYVFIP